jgi:uncharacterized membrane protein YukC
MFSEKESNLHIRGKSSYQTNIGAFVSVCIKIILYLFIAYEFYVIFKRKHPKISIKHSVNSFVKDP